MWSRMVKGCRSYDWLLAGAALAIEPCHHGVPDNQPRARARVAAAGSACAGRGDAAPRWQIAGTAVAQSSCRTAAAQSCSADMPIRTCLSSLPETIDTCVLGQRRAASALLLTEPRGERASAALPHRRRNGALKRAHASTRPPAAPRARGPAPAGPKPTHPNPPTQGREGCIEARPSGVADFSCSTVKFRRSCSRRRRERWGLLFGRRLHVREYALGALRASGPPHGGRLRPRCTTASVVTRYRGWRDRGGPCRSQPRASEWIAGAGQADVSGAGAAGFFVSGRRLVICGRIEFQR